MRGVDGAAPGSDVSALPVWNALPDGTPWSTRAAVVTSHDEGGTAMLGGVETVPELGWAVAVWRPEAEAYAALEAMKLRSAITVLVALLLAIAVGARAGTAVTRPVREIARQARLIGQRKWREVKLPAGSDDELGELARSVGKMAGDLERGEQQIEHEAKLRGDLGRFMPRELVEAIVSGEHSLELGGKRMEISVLFADVVAFTPMAETRDATRVVALLNELFSVLSEVVFRHEGIVDKFIGDCIMAVWGAPEPREDHAERALAAAEDMLRFLETANDEWRERYGCEIRLGIGVNSGEAIVGNIGSSKRMEYTVIGDTVNVAARLEAIARPDQILVPEAVAERVGDAFDLQFVGEHNLTGRAETTRVYELQV